MAAVATGLAAAATAATGITTTAPTTAAAAAALPGNLTPDKDLACYQSSTFLLFQFLIA